MKHVLTPLIATFLLAAAGAAVSMPLWRRFCRRLGLIDAPGHRKIHHQPVALAGGLVVLTGLIGAAAFWWAVRALHAGPPFLHGLAMEPGSGGPRFAVIVAGIPAMFLLGLLDDRLELRPGAKFLGQLVVAAGAALGGVRCGIFSDQPALQLAVTVLWILTVTNAFNFIDNMNGLCAGLCLVAAIAIATIAGRSQEPLPAAVAAALAGAALGFLPFNYPRATAFPGDSGSHLIGFTLAVMTIHPGLWRDSAISAAPVIGPMLLLAVPLLDLCWVVCHRTWMRKPFYVGDNNHLSHQLVRTGLPHPAAVALLWAAALAGCIVAVQLH